MRPRADDSGGSLPLPSDGDDYWYQQRSAPNAVGVRITADSSLKCSVVFRCITILADIISTLPMSIYKLRTPGVIDGGMDNAPNHPVHDVISINPNVRQTAAEFWGQMLFHAALRGIAYAEIIPGPRGAVDQLEPIHPDRVTPELMPDRTIRFKVRDPKTLATRVLLQEEMLRVPGLTSDGVTGLRTVDLAAEAIALLMAADQYAARVFSNNLNVGGFFTHPGKLSKEAKQNLLAKLTQRLTGIFNSHRPMVLDEGMKFEKASMDANRAQLLEARKWQVCEIARYWGVPLHMLGIDDQTNRATVEEQWLNFVRVTLKPWVGKIEQAISRDLIIVPRVYVAQINLDDLERGNMQARAEYISKMLGSGGSQAVLTVNECRGIEGYNPDSDPSSDKLAKGINPVSQPGSGAPAQAPAAAVIDTIKPAIADESTAPPILAMFRKEVAALRRLNVKHADDPAVFRKAVAAFYGGFASEVAKKLGVTKKQSKDWCNSRSARIAGANDVNAAIDAIEAEIEAEAGAQNGD
jgi:HK97 family phage portal protein